MVPPQLLFDWYPLTCMYAATLQDDLPEMIDLCDPRCLVSRERQLVALCRPDDARRSDRHVPIPGTVVREMQHGDPLNPIFMLHKDDPDNWGRVQREINTAAERVAARTITAPAVLPP